MANDFNEGIDIFFEDLVSGFDAANVTAKNVSMYKPDVGQLATGGQTFYRPVEMMVERVDGLDISSAYKDLVEMSVPTSLTVGQLRNIPIQLEGVDLNNEYVRRNIVRRANVKLSNALDSIVAEEIAKKATLVVTSSGNFDDYEKLAEAETVMLEQQVTASDRCMLLNPRMAPKIASDLASRSTMTGAPMEAYRRTALPSIAGFETFKTDYGFTLDASSGTGYLVNGANQHHTPIANDANGVPVDNRQQTLVVDTGTGAAVGDCFTIAGVYSVGQINKQSTDQLKTFRILAIDGANWTISPAIVPADGTAAGQAAYANVSTTPADNAAITILNTQKKAVSLFYEKSAVEIVHADFDLGAFRANGNNARTATTDSGVRIALLSETEIDTLKVKHRMFIWANATVLEPQAAGILLPGQT